jgi:hypothetical protein
MTYATIHVILIEGATGRILGQSDLSIDQLPASFETSTTLHLGNQDWHVDKAEPPKAEEFAQTGALRLTLSRVSYLDPKKILFTLPTLDAAIPHPDGHIVAPSLRTLQLHEDDWRQIEFVSAKYAREIEAELVDIRTIFREHSVDNGSFLGFCEIHMRRRIPSPIDPPFPIGHVQTALGVTGVSLDAVSFERMPGIVPVSFAFQVGDLLVYGTGDANSARCLCIHRHNSSLPESVLSGIQRLMSAHELYLVDWCRMGMFTPNDATSLARFFSIQ